MRDELAPILGILEPYLADVVLIGGWVPELYRRFGGLSWTEPPSHTTELDVLVGHTLDPKGRPKLRQLLEAGGLRPARPEPFPADWVRTADDVTAIEFLMPRPGPHVTDAIRQVDAQGYLGAIVLDDAEVLQRFTTTLTVASTHRQWTVVVPTLGAWLAGKVLTYGTRHVPDDAPADDDKRTKDLAYIRDLLHAGPQVYARVFDDLRAMAQDSRGLKILKRTQRVLIRPIELAVSRAAARLASRDGGAPASARAEILGTLSEVRHLIEDARS